MPSRPWLSVTAGALAIALCAPVSMLISSPANAAEPDTVIDVLSDIQGPTGNKHLREKAIPTLNARTWKPDALVTVGDLVSAGSTSNWKAYEEALAANGGHVAKRNIAAIGNHEYYGSEGSDTYKQRFLKHAKRSNVWTEQVVDGVPVIVVGSEQYSYPERTGDGPFVTFSKAQLDWFSARMTYWKSKNVPVLVFTHNVLPKSVSGTSVKFYQNDFGSQLQTFKDILRKNDKAVLFTAHTHWSLDRPDWTKNYDLGGGATIPVFNTGALTNAYGPNGTGETTLAGEHASGLRVFVTGRNVTVEAWDFMKGKVVNKKTFTV